ncbi:exodeoxyribonuclease III [Oxyplasma meridianum]|uniref:Exodeoxyribonuclease III n=1 Tax=Oxyplasma meridianum TaxID=3073602 RepID=A0AAX4NIB4_9ARCH
MRIKLLSWNVNGIRSAVKNGALRDIEELDPDFICLQEIKSDEKTVPLEITSLGYSAFVNPAKKRGYSGTMILTKEKPLSVKTGIGSMQFDEEGRVLSVETEKFWLINVYFPNSQRDLVRLDYKLEFDREFGSYCLELQKTKPLIIAGDFNVAHEDIDIARPDENRNNAGFTNQERNWMTRFLDSGFIDTFRMFNREPGNYSWWTYRFNAREKNIGWRIDYFIVSEILRKNTKTSTILKDIKGSDHAPLSLEIEFP